MLRLHFIIFRQKFDKKMVYMRTTALYHADLSIAWDVLVRHALTTMSQNASLHIVIVVLNPNTSWIQ